MKFHLEPIDWLLNPWLPHKPWPKLDPREFNPSKRTTWPTADTGRDEALIMWNSRLDRKIKTPLEDFSSTLRFAEMGAFDTTEVMTLIAKMYSVEHLADWIQAVPSRPTGSSYDDSFRICILPYLTNDERNCLAAAIRQQAINNSAPNHPSLILAGLLGTPPEIASHLDSQIQAGWINEDARFAILGLPTAQVHQRHEWLAKGSYTDQMVGLIAHTGLEYIAKIAAYGNEARVRALADIVRDPAAAPFLLPLLDAPKLAPPTRAWFDRYGIDAADAIAAHPWKTSSAKDRKQREAALVLAESLRTRNGGGSIAKSKPVVGFDFGVFKKSPGWIDAATLPPIELTDPPAQLDTKSTQDLLALLAATPPLEVPPPIAKLKRSATPDSLDRLSLELLEAWRQGGMKPKDRWALASVGLFGGPLSTARLSANLASWSGGGRYDSARLGYQCLLKVGALWEVCGPALRGLSFAKEAAEAEALQRNLSFDEFAETVMPHYGFDTRGEREFAIGDRKLKLKASRELRIFDENGKLLDAIPKARKTDDAAVHTEAVANFKTLKLEYERCVRGETKRFEKACFYARKFSLAHVQRYILPHPVMGAIARTLVWGAFNENARRLTTFRFDEAGSLAGIDDREVTLSGDAAYLRILRLHDFVGEERKHWMLLLSDYDKVQAFPQLAPLAEPKETSSLIWALFMELNMALTHFPQSEAQRMVGWLNWLNDSPDLAPCNAGFAQSPLPLDRFERQLDDCLFRRVSDQLAQRVIAKHAAKLHYIHMGAVGLGWLLQIEDPEGCALQSHSVDTSILDILAEDFQQLGLRG